mmetsp:Transcript_13679/g.19111  ORF Transcript_13679/g.19111 Transcript_13679/m.19111 type:complete len:618 (-) Transcript_13679:121-1974(-)
MASKGKVDEDGQGKNSDVIVAAHILRHRTRFHFEKKFTQYEITISVSNMSWSIFRRYSEFEMLNKKLNRDLKKKPKLPGKKWTGNMVEAFLESRKKGLESYLQQLLALPEAMSNVAVLEFLGFLSDHSKESKRKRIQAEQISRIAKPGDVVLFRTQGALPALQRTVLSSDYDHVGIVVTKYMSKFKNKNFEVIGGLYLLESTNEGVLTYPLRSRLRAWHLSGAVMVIRRLAFGHKEKEVVYQQLQEFASEAEGKNYGLSPLKLLRRKASPTSQETTYFCSELVASAYQMIGFLPSSAAASTYYPSTFGEKSNLKLMGDATLSNEVMIEFWQPEVLRARFFQGKNMRSRSAGRRSKRIGSNPTKPTTRSKSPRTRNRQRSAIVPQGPSSSSSATNIDSSRQDDVKHLNHRGRKAGETNTSTSTNTETKKGKMGSKTCNDDQRKTITVLKPEKRDTFFIHMDPSSSSSSQGLGDCNSSGNDDQRFISIPLHLSTSQEVFKSQLSITLLAGLHAVECDFGIEDEEKGTGNVLIPWDTPPGNYRLKISSTLSPFITGYSPWFCLKKEAPSNEQKKIKQLLDEETVAAKEAARMEKAGKSGTSDAPSSAAVVAEETFDRVVP